MNKNYQDEIRWFWYKIWCLIYSVIRKLEKLEHSRESDKEEIWNQAGVVTYRSGVDEKKIERRINNILYVFVRYGKNDFTGNWCWGKYPITTYDHLENIAVCGCFTPFSIFTWWMNNASRESMCGIMKNAPS